MRKLAVVFALLCLGTAQPVFAARLKELVDVEGFRPNALVGMGLVVGLTGTGDDIISSAFSRHELSTLARHLGIVIDPKDILSKNVAAVMVTANLPPFSRPGSPIDVVVSSMGGAKSLQGGTLVSTPLKGADRETYAIAQGPLTLGGFAEGGASGTSSRKNHVTVGRIPSGARIEREAPGALPKDAVVLLLRDPDFTTAMRIAQAVNQSLGQPSARVRDPGAVEVAIAPQWKGKTVQLIAQLEAVDAVPDVPGRVVIDERTGTIVVGTNVTLLPSAIAHGGLTVQVTEIKGVSQPNALTQGAQTVVTPETHVDVQEEKGGLVPLGAAGTVGDVAAALNAIGVKPRDLVSIFQALKAAGALRAEIEVL